MFQNGAAQERPTVIGTITVMKTDVKTEPQDRGYDDEGPSPQQCSNCATLKRKLYDTDQELQVNFNAFTINRCIC